MEGKLPLSDRSICLVLMGVSGSGKTSVGKKLSEILGWVFYDGDDFHPKENIDKMATGTPLSDSDRVPWLACLSNLIADNISADRSMILACSALKEIYREQLISDKNPVVFIYLKGDFRLIWERMKIRLNHYMKPEMLHSQFETLEEPKEAIIINIDQSISQIVKTILSELRLQ